MLEHVESACKDAYTSRARRSVAKLSSVGIAAMFLVQKAVLLAIENAHTGASIPDVPASVDSPAFHAKSHVTGRAVIVAARSCAMNCVIENHAMNLAASCFHANIHALDSVGNHVPLYAEFVMQTKLLQFSLVLRTSLMPDLFAWKTASMFWKQLGWSNG